jgi:hypothetical protein
MLTNVGDCLRCLTPYRGHPSGRKIGIGDPGGRQTNKNNHQWQYQAQNVADVFLLEFDFDDTARTEVVPKFRRLMVMSFICSCRNKMSLTLELISCFTPPL